MSQLKIVQSLNVLHIATMNTYEAVLQDGKEGLKLLGSDTILTGAALPPVDGLLVVFPVIPAAGDLVVSYLEGELVYGEIKQIGDNSTFVIDFDGVGAVSLSRNQFHVTATTSSIPNDELSEGLNVIVVDGDENFPTGSRAIITHVGVTKGIPSKTVILARNALEWVWDINEVGFRYPDPTLVDFEFTDDPEQVDLDALALAAVEGALPEASEIAEISDDVFSFTVNDLDGNPVAWADLPEEVQATLSNVAEQIKELGPEGFGDLCAEVAALNEETAAVNEEAEVLQPVETATAPMPNPFYFLGAMFQAIADEIREEELNKIADASVSDQLEHEGFVDALNVGLDDNLQGALQKLSLGMNLLGRMASNCNNPVTFAQFQSVSTVLAEARGLLYEATKTQLDIVTDIGVNRVIQRNYAEVAGALN